MRWFIILTIFLTGCSSTSRHKIVYPSDSLYLEANRIFENNNFEEAIDLYQRYLDEKPRSKYTVPSKLNLGMSYYYTENYKDAYLVLSKLTIEDPNIKAYVERVVKDCQSKGGDEVVMLAKADAQTNVAGKKSNGIRITIQDAYVDDFGSVVLVGITSKEATIHVNGTRTGVNDKNEFTISVFWRKGQPIDILAKDRSGRIGELTYFPDREPPEEPEGLRVINTSSNTLEIEWDGNTENDIKGYRLYYQSNRSSQLEVRELIKDKRHELVGLSRLITATDRTIKVIIKAVDKMDNESDPSDTLEVDLPL